MPITSFIKEPNKNMHDVKKTFVSILSIPICLLILLFGNLGNGNVKAEGVDFQISPRPSSMQLNKKVSYFDLKLKPGATTRVQVEVANNSTKTIHVTTYATSATTSDNGNVVYNKTNAKPDKSLKYKMSALAKTDTSKLTLKPKAKQLVTYVVTMPSKKFDGLLVGGLTFIQSAKDTENKSKKGVALTNQYAYTEALVLHGQTEKSVGTLALKKVSVGQLNYRNTVFSTLVNNKSNFVNQLKIDQKIYASNGGHVLYHSKNKMLQVAPNSKFRWATQLNGDKFKPGKYKLVMNASATEGRKWHFVKYFTVNDKTAKKLNKKDVTVKTDYTWIYILVIVVLVVLVAFLGYKWYKGNKQKEQELKALKEKAKKE